jgi:hypothetical protein
VVNINFWLRVLNHAYLLKMWPGVREGRGVDENVDIVCPFLRLPMDALSNGLLCSHFGVRAIHAVPEQHHPHFHYSQESFGQQLVLPPGLKRRKTSHNILVLEDETSGETRTITPVFS